MRRNRWDDYYARRAREEKWLARSVYKLQEIDRKFKLIRTGCRVLDLGCSPGSWSQYALKKVGKEGDVVGIDLNPPGRLPYSNFRFLKADITSLNAEWLRRRVSPRDVVLSDLAPMTTGIAVTDAARSMALAESAAEVALSVLTERGNFVCKVLEGEDFRDYKLRIASYFQEVRLLRPKATRKRSKEIYLVGLGFKGGG